MSALVLPLALAATASPAHGGEDCSLRLPYVTPLALKVARVSQRDCLWIMPTRERVVALTFDDGPSVKYLPGVLDALDRQDWKATFFVLGSRLDEKNPDGKQRIDLLREIARRGHEIALHGQSHRPFTKMTDEEIRREIHAQRRSIREILGMDAIRFVRPPFGRINRRVARVLAEEGLVAVNASILPGDAHWPRGWSEAWPRTATRIGRELHPGGIICLHVGEDVGGRDQVFDMPDTARNVAQLVSILRDNRYRVVRLGDFIPRTPSDYRFPEKIR